MQRQAEINLIQGQTDCVALPAVDAGKSTDPCTADEQLVNINSRGRFINIRRRDIVRKGDCPRLLLNTEIARQLHKTKDVNLKIARGAQKFAFRCIHGQGETRWLGPCPGDHGQALGGVVHQRTIVRGTIDLYVEGVGRYRQILNADKSRTAGCLQRCPFALHITLRLKTRRFLPKQSKRKINVGKAQTESVARQAAVTLISAVDARKGIQAGTSDCQKISTYDHAVGQGHTGRVCLFKSHITGHGKKIRNRYFSQSSCADNLAPGTGKIEFHLALIRKIDKHII